MSTRLAVACVALAFVAGCTPRDAGPGYPLYLNPQNRLPASQVARLAVPIGSVDGRDVSAQGEVFDLLPGCHVVQLHGEMAQSNAYVAWSGRVPRLLFALRMKAGRTYVIRREIVQDMNATTGRVVVIAYEEDSSGKSTPLTPVQSAMEIQACKERESRGE